MVEKITPEQWVDEVYYEGGLFMAVAFGADETNIDPEEDPALFEKARQAVSLVQAAIQAEEDLLSYVEAKHRREDTTKTRLTEPVYE